MQIKNGNIWTTVELVCFDTPSTYQDHWEKLGGRYSTSPAVGGTLCLLIIDDLNETEVPDPLQYSEDILTIWLRHDEYYRTIQISSSLDSGQAVETFAVDQLQRAQASQQSHSHPEKPKATNVDAGGTVRGECTECKEGECPKYVVGKTGSDCDICGHKPAKHVNLSKSE